jgi:two-component system, chemotaxis family, protein-glutamate methylesterase/glutaminase
MKINGKIKVLVVDDSYFYREVLARGLSSDPLIEVVATAQDPFEARDKIIEFEPDVMTCDVEMPKMNGIEFIRRLLPQYPLPVVVVSTVNGAVFDAMNAGAVEFAAKPNPSSVAEIEAFLRELIAKVKIAAKADVAKRRAAVMGAAEAGMAKSPLREGAPTQLHKLIAIGASTGGTEAITRVIQSLPPKMPGIVIVQHIPPVFSSMFAERLNASVSLEVKEAKTGDWAEEGKVLVAPGDRHMRVKRVGDRYKVECFQGDRVNGHCPSVDVLFDSVAREAGPAAIGVLLTGMGYDGAKGLLTMRRKGARTIGQDEASSVVYGMPKAAYEIGAVEKQSTLANIGPLLCNLLK